MAYSLTCTLQTGALALQTSSFKLSEDQYVEAAVQAVVSVDCVGDEAGLRECSWVTTSIDSDERCTIDRIAEVVCQGMYINWL